MIDHHYSIRILYLTLDKENVPIIVWTKTNGSSYESYYI